MKLCCEVSKGCFLRDMPLGGVFTLCGTPKPLRVYMKIQNENVIRLVGDPSGIKVLMTSDAVAFLHPNACINLDGS